MCSRKLSFSVRKEGQVKLLFFRTEVIATNNNSSRWQTQIISSFNLDRSKQKILNIGAEELVTAYLCTP